MIKILVVGPSWVGDMVMAQSLFKALRDKFASQPVTLDVLAPAWTHALLSAMPEVDTAIPMPLGHGSFGLAKRYQLGKSLRATQYTHAYVLPNSWKSALIPWFAKIPKRIGWRGELRWGLLNDCRKLLKKRFPYMVQRFVALAEEKPSVSGRPLENIQFPSMQVSKQSVEKTLKKFIPQAEQELKPLLSLCPGAEFGPSKQWPAAYYATIAKHYVRAGWRVCILGSINDAPIANEIGNNVNHTAEGQQHCLVLAGKTQLQEAIELLASSTAVVSNDSGLMHIAAALNKPVVAIFGSTDPSFTPPLTAHAKMIESSVSCRPCFERTCPLKHHQCMQTVYPVQVIDALESLLTEGAI
jgi:heptosyltransferase-2